MNSTMPRLSIYTVGVALVVGSRAFALCQAAHPNDPAVGITLPSVLAAPPASDGKWKFFGSERIRVEDWNWFPTPKANGAYSFVGSLLRAGVMRSTSKEDVVIEFAATGLFNLPTKASVAAPQGALGQGANYYASNHKQVLEAFPKQAFIRFKDIGAAGSSVKVGRFEFSDGAEVTPADATLAWLTANRISARLLGPFTFMDVGRSFDGVQLEAKSPKIDTTLVAGFPTRGVFDLDGWDTLTRVPFGYLSQTTFQPGAKASGESRWFTLYYGDTRNVAKVDNRPTAIRAGDHGQIDLVTFGGDYLRTSQIGSSKIDALVWAAGQSGKWGKLDQAAFSYDAEGGWQFPNVTWKPWLRAGYFFASGSGSNNSGVHATFNPILPTPRLYSRYPFYTESNLKDLFASAILQPTKKLSLRSEIHQLRLASSKDDWYVGGGAYDNSTFGYTGRPSNGFTNLGTLTDISADYQFRKDTTISLYLAYVSDGAVEKSIYGSGDSVYLYGELTYKF